MSAECMWWWLSLGDGCVVLERTDGNATVEDVLMSAFVAGAVKQEEKVVTYACPEANVSAAELEALRELPRLERIDRVRLARAELSFDALIDHQVELRLLD